MGSGRVLLPTAYGVAGAVLLCGAVGALAQNTTSPSAVDKKFVRAALQGDNAEVQLGELAVQKGGSEDVKRFAQKMVDDHTKMSDQMKDVGRKEEISVLSGVSGKDKEVENKLRSLSGDSFDKAYIKATVAYHRRDLSEFQKEASSGNDTSIKDMARQEEQAISEHLKMAEQMAKKHNLQVNSSNRKAQMGRSL